MASVLLSPRALVEKITTDLTSKTPKVTGTLIQSVEEDRFPDKTIVLIFEFKIAGQPAENPKQSDSFGYPNKFWIVTEPGKEK